MSYTDWTRIGIAALVGVILTVAFFVWSRGPSEATVRRTVVTTLQEEAPASFLVTGTLKMNVTVRVDSAQFLTPAWLTVLVEHAHPAALLVLRGGSETKVQVPGTVSYGFDVRSITPTMITVGEKNRIDLKLPSLSVHSVEPKLSLLKVRSQSSGWVRVLPSDLPEDVRTEALAAVRGAFRKQAEKRIETATQPRVNTARAMTAMLRPALESAGISSPRFRIEIGDDLVMRPEE